MRDAFYVRDAWDFLLLSKIDSATLWTFLTFLVLALVLGIVALALKVMALALGIVALLTSLS